MACAILGEMVFGDVDITYVDYHNVNTIIEEFYSGSNKFNYDNIFITDISVSEDVAVIIEHYNDASNIPKTVLLDHHSTAEWLNKYDWATVTEIDEELQEKTSAAYMFYKYLVENNYLQKTNRNVKSLEGFANTVRKYDTWLWKEKYNDSFPKKLNDLMYIMGRERFMTNIKEKLLNSTSLLDQMCLYLLELEQEKIDKYIKHKNNNLITRRLNGYIVGIVFAEQYHSELGNDLCELNPQLDFVVIINIDKSINYRGIKDNIHLGQDIAKLYGGGGHPKAAGSPIKDNIKDEVIKLLFWGLSEE